jgi:hypothetical protein
VAAVTAIAGPRLDLDGPRPVAPPYSLLNTPGVVISEGDDGRWLNGVNLIGYPEGTPHLWNECQTGTFEIKSEGDAGPEAQFDSFVCYLPVTCSGLSYPYIREWSETVLDATYSLAVEQALVGRVAVGLGPNPALGNASCTILGGGAAKSPEKALAYAENAIGSTGRKGMIHTSPAVVAALQSDLHWPNGALQTVNGTPVVSGDGYIGATAHGTPPGDGRDWIFVSGPVEVRISSLVITDLAESLDMSDNTLTFRAERWVLVVWDTSLQAAVLVDWDA